MTYSTWHTETRRQFRMTLSVLTMPGCTTFIIEGLRRRVNCGEGSLFVPAPAKHPRLAVYMYMYICDSIFNK